jgi:16S rRNA processing protein RimM
MTREDCFTLGEITRLHGYKGEVVLFVDADQPDAYAQLDAILIDENGALLPLAIEHMDDLGRGKFKVKFEGIASSAEASRLLKREVLLPLELLPPLEGKKFYYHEITDFMVMDANNGPLGKVSKVLEHPVNPILVVDCNGAEVLVPARDEFIDSIDRGAKMLRVNLPEGLLEVYTRPSVNDEGDDHTPEAQAES